MRIYEIEIVGTTSLLMHADNINWADVMENWKNNPENKKTSKAGDDRTPSWRWIGSAYHNTEVIGVPSANIMRAVMEGGAMVLVPGGRSGKTYKAQTQSGMISVGDLWPLYINGKTIQWGPIEALKKEQSFVAHKIAVQEMGFNLLVKRAKIGSSKHIRVRPEFPPGWTISGLLNVWDEQISQSALQSILDYAGRYKGLGDWRPGGRTPGPHGTFEVEILSASDVAG